MTVNSRMTAPVPDSPPPGLKSLVPTPARRIALIILGQKILFAILLFSAPALAPSYFSTQQSVEHRFTQWDSAHYLHLAAHGYRAGTGLCAFYPLWPVCIRIGSFLTGGNFMVSGYLLVNLFSFLGLLLFHRFVWEKHGLELANRATVLLLLFPGSIFFFFPYTESLFLLLLMTQLLCLSRANHQGAAITAFFLPLTRAIGIFILPVMVWELWRKKSPIRNYWICAAPLLGYALYFAIMYSSTGNAFEGFDAQQRFPARPSIARITDITGFLHHFADFRWDHDPLRSYIDRGLFIVFLASLYWVFRADTGYYIYAVCSGLIPALSNILMSYTRFLSLVFPLFIVGAQLTIRTRLFWLFCFVCGVMQFIFFFRILLGRWAG